MELQVSFVAVGTGHNRVKVTTRLQAVTLLEDKHSRVSPSPIPLSSSSPPLPGRSLGEIQVYGYTDRESSDPEENRVFYR